MMVRSLSITFDSAAQSREKTEIVQQIVDAANGLSMAFSDIQCTENEVAMSINANDAELSAFLDYIRFFKPVSDVCENIKPSSL